MAELSVTETTRIRRLGERQVTDRDVLYAILDEALLAHVAYVRDGQPVVLPFACARDGDVLLLHGSTGAGLIRSITSGIPIAAAVTHLDALVVARSTFDNSMNYRSAVVLGVPEVLTGEAGVDALRRLVDHQLPGRWDEVRPSTRRELAATAVLRLALDEASVKVRTGWPSVADDDGEDRSTWAGLLPLTTVSGETVTEPSVPAGTPVPDSVLAAARRMDSRT